MKADHVLLFVDWLFIESRSEGGLRTPPQDHADAFMSSYLCCHLNGGSPWHPHGSDPNPAGGLGSANLRLSSLISLIFEFGYSTRSLQSHGQDLLSNTAGPVGSQGRVSLSLGEMVSPLSALKSNSLDDF